MSEYIIEIPDYTSPSDPAARAATLGEEVVRCRDCKHFSPEYEFEEEVGPNGERERCIEPPSCGNPKRCSMFYDSFIEKYVPVHIYTEPNGFCAWGERRVER